MFYNVHQVEFSGILNQVNYLLTKVIKNVSFSAHGKKKNKKKITYVNICTEFSKTFCLQQLLMGYYFYF